MALNPRQIGERDSFFGRNNYKNRSNFCLTYKPIISEDEIIVRTDHVVSIITKDKCVQFLLLVANNKAVYLDYYRQLRRVVWYPDGEKKSTYLVKLFRNRFRPYYCKRFAGHEIQGELTFDSLYEEARLQGCQKNLKVRMF